MLVMDPYPKIDFIEDIQTDLICTTIFEDLGSPKGVAGMVDWRLNGFISRNLLSKTMQGDFRESVLIPLDSPFSSKRLCLFGLGSWRTYNSLTLKRLLPKVLQTIMHLKPESCLVCIPRLLKESHKNETQDILNEFFQDIALDIRLEIQVTPIA